MTTTTQEQKQIASLEIQLESLDEQLTELVTVNEKSKSACENMIRNLNGIGGVAKMVLQCHQMANDIQNFEAELAALNGEELNAREENVLLRRELENAVKCMETLLLDTEPALMIAASKNNNNNKPNSNSNSSTSGLLSRKL